MSSDAKKALLEAAADVFGHFGFKKASVEDIARLAGVGKGTVYLHFDSKEALLEAVMRQLLGQDGAEVEAQVEQATSPADKLRAFFDAKLALLERMTRRKLATFKNRGFASMETAIEFAGASPNVVAEFRERDIKLVTSILEEGRSAGVFHLDDARILAVGIIDFLMFTSVKIITWDDESRIAVRAVVNCLVGGLLAGTPSPSPKES